MMNSIIIDNKIYVDFWEDHEVNECSHFMSSIFPNMSCILNSSWKCPIYSSELNIMFLFKFTNINKKLLKPLKFYEKATISKNNYKFDVCAINSKSYTGHVIYHFCCSGLNHLYLGSTNLSVSNMKDEYLINLSKNKMIDAVYIDTSIIRVPVHFTTKSAIGQIIDLLKKKKVVIAMHSLGMEDLLVNLALQGYSIHVGLRRLKFLELQGADINLTSSKEAMIRVVDKQHCENIIRSYRRYLQKNIITVIPSALYNLNEIEEMKNVGTNIIFYSDSMTAHNLRQFLKAFKPQRLIGCNNKLMEDISSLLDQNLIPLNLNLASYKQFSSSNIKDFQDRERLDHSIPLNDNNSSMFFQNLSESPERCNLDDKPEEVRTNILAKDKNIDHLFTDTQVSFAPLATSTQRPTNSQNENEIQSKNNESSSSQPIETTSKSTQNIFVSQNNMNRFVSDYVNDENNQKNKLNRMNLVHIFNGNSINRIASISKSKRLKEKCVQTDNEFESIISKSNVEQNHIELSNMKAKPNDGNITSVEPNNFLDYSDLDIISSSDNGFNSSPGESIIPDLNLECIETCEILIPDNPPVQNNNSSSQGSYFSSVSNVNDSLALTDYLQDEDYEHINSNNLVSAMNVYSPDMVKPNQLKSNESSFSSSSESSCLSDIVMLSDELNDDG